MRHLVDYAVPGRLPTLIEALVTREVYRDDPAIHVSKFQSSSNEGGEGLAVRLHLAFT